MYIKPHEFRRSSIQRTRPPRSRQEGGGAQVQRACSPPTPAAGRIWIRKPEGAGRQMCAGTAVPGRRREGVAQWRLRLATLSHPLRPFPTSASGALV